MRHRGFWLTSLFTLALSSASYAQSNAQPFPWNITFEEPTYSTTGNGGAGRIYIGSPTVSAQDFWVGGSIHFVRADAAQSGTQGLLINTGILAPPLTTYGAYRNFFNTTTGYTVLSCYFKMVDNVAPVGKGCIGLETWANNGANRVAAVFINSDGQTYLRRRSEEVIGTGSLLATNLTVTPTNWNKVTVIYDHANIAMYGMINGTVMTDGTNPLTLTFADLATRNLMQVGLQFSPGNSAQRRATGIPSTEAVYNGTVYSDNITLRQFNDPRSAGIKVNLGDFAGGGRLLANIPVSVTFTPTGGGSDTTITATMDAFGGVSAVAPSAGNYSIKVKPSGWCAKTLTNIEVREWGAYELEVLCQNGDVDNSGEVDAADIDAVIANFGATGDAVQEDADGSGEVDAADIDIIIANFGGTDQ